MWKIIYRYFLNKYFSQILLSLFLRPCRVRFKNVSGSKRKSHVSVDKRGRYLKKGTLVLKLIVNKCKLNISVPKYPYHRFLAGHRRCFYSISTITLIDTYSIQLVYKY